MKADRSRERGEGKWEQIIWEEAVETISGKFKAYQEEFGKQLVVVSTVSGNMAFLNGFLSLYRFANLLGATQTDYSLDMPDRRFYVS